MMPIRMVLCWLLLCGCTTGAAREARCLAALTPAFLEAEQELQVLEGTWRSGRATWAVESSLEQAEAKLRDARARHQPAREWYARVYERVWTRVEEDRLRSEVFWTLVTGPGILFYPIVAWNLHAVFWDGHDPDAESDPIRRFCEGLVQENAARGQEGMQETGR